MLVCYHVVVLGLSVRLACYVVVVVTVMRVLLFVFDVSMLSEGVRVTAMLVRGGAWHEYVSGTRGSGIVSSAAGVLFFSSFILSTGLVPASMVVSPNGLLEYCFLYVS